MPHVSGIFGPVFVNTTLDGSGNGFVAFQATGQGVIIRNRSVRCSTAVKEATASTYRQSIGPAYLIDATYAGSTGDNNADPIPLHDGETIYIAWVGGDAGATATATFSGEAETSGGFRVS